MFDFIKLYKWPIAFAAFLLYTVLMFGAGWQVHTYYVGYQQNQTEQVMKVVKEGISDYQRSQAQGLADTLKLLDGIDPRLKVKETTIIKQPIYQIGCMNQDGVDLLKERKEKSAAIINGTKK